MQGDELPTVVYLVTVDTEWPVSVVVQDRGEAIAIEDVEKVVQRRRASGNVSRSSQVHVWKSELSNVREVDLMPTTVVRASIRER